MGNINNSLLRVMIIIALAILNSCHAQAIPYNTVIRNIGTKKFSDSTIILNNKTLSVGWVSPGKYAVNDRPSTPLPDTVVVSWQREGKTFNQKLIIKGKLSKITSNEEYYLIFNIDDNETATLKVVTCDQSEPCINKW